MAAEEVELSDVDELHREYRRTHDPLVRERLVLRYAGLARDVARRFRNTSEPFEDLVQVAYCALIGAIDRYDPDRAASFRTYASAVINGELKRYFRDRTWRVRVPRALQERSLDVRRAADSLRAGIGRSPTPREIAAHLRLDEEDVVEAMAVASSYTTVSLDAGHGGPPSALVSHDRGYDRIDSDLERAALLPVLLRRLDEEDRRIVDLYFGNGLSQGEVAAALGTTQASVSRRLRRVTARLRVVASAIS